MLTMKKMALGVAGAALAMSSLTLTGAANAAAPCAAENQAAGASHANDVTYSAKARQAAKRFKKAKKANAQHHTAATKRELNAARKAYRKALAKSRTVHAHAVAAADIAAKCQASGGTSSSTSTVTPAAVASQLTSGLTGLGVPSAVASQVGSALASALGNNITTAQLSDLLTQLKPVLSALNAAGVPLDASTIEKAIAALTGSGLPNGSVQGILTTLTSALGSSLPSGDLAKVLNTVLAQLGTGQLGTNPATLVPSLITTVKGVLGGLTDLTGVQVSALDTTLNTVQPSLTTLLGSLTGAGGLLQGLAPTLDPILISLGL